MFPVQKENCDQDSLATLPLGAYTSLHCDVWFVTKDTPPVVQTGSTLKGLLLVFPGLEAQELFVIVSNTSLLNPGTPPIKLLLL